MSSERKTKEESVTLGPDVREGQHVFGVAHIFASSDDTFIKVTDLSGKETLVRITGENVKRMKRALKYTRWTREDDETLIRCWLNTSKDPIAGDDQSNIAYWKKIANRLNKITGQSRTSNQCKSHWSSTIRFVNHFCDCYRRAKALNPSGWSEDQYVKKAHELYRQEKGKPFTLDHWWEALNNEAKWNNKHTEESASKKAKTNEHGTYTTASNNCLYDGNINCLQSIELNNEGKSNQKYKEKIASKKAKEDEHGTFITSFHNCSSEGNVNGSQSIEQNNEGKSNHKYMEECASKDAKVDEHGTYITSFDNCLSDGNINYSQLIEQNNEGKSNQKYNEESASKITEVDEHGTSYITSFENCLSEGNINSSQSIEQNNEGKSNPKHTEESASKKAKVDEHGTYITSFGNCLSDSNIDNSSQSIEQNNEGKSNQKYKDESASEKTKADEHGTHITSSDNCLSEGDINSSQLIERRAAERDKGKDKALETNDFMKDMLQVEKQKLEIQKDLVASKNISTYLKLLEVDTSNMSNDLRVRHEKIVEKFMDKLLDM